MMRILKRKGQERLIQQPLINSRLNLLRVLITCQPGIHTAKPITIKLLLEQSNDSQDELWDTGEVSFFLRLLGHSLCAIAVLYVMKIGGIFFLHLV